MKTWAAAALAVCVLAGAVFWRRADADRTLTTVVQRGSLTAQLTVGGTLRPAESLTYHSPLGGREAEIIELVPEGTRVKEGDLLVRLDTTDLERDIDRARGEVRQALMDVQLADIERQDAEAAVKGVAEGEGAVTAEEARTRLQLAQKRVERLRQETEALAPLLDKGFITREELRKTSDELEQAEEDLALARKRNDVLTDLTRPRDAQHAALQLAQKRSQVDNAQARAVEAQIRLNVLTLQRDASRIYAKAPGLVVYEELLTVSPRRKIHVGDRVTGSQGLVTIPEVSRMLLEGSVSEADVHRVRAGQTAAIHVEAFADALLTGKVLRVGTLARNAPDRPFEDKRFDVIVELDPTTIDLRPEMTARADVLVGTRQNVLLVPSNAVFERQGQPVAHVVSAAGIETRALALGESNDMIVEVTSGLREGERVALAVESSPSGSRSATGTAAVPAPSAAFGSSGTFGASPDLRERGAREGHALQPR